MNKKEAIEKVNNIRNIAILTRRIFGKTREMKYIIFPEFCVNLSNWRRKTIVNHLILVYDLIPSKVNKWPRELISSRKIKGIHKK